MDHLPRFLALLSELHRERVEYVLVGGVAVNLHGIPRATQAIDFFVRPEADNVARLKRALHGVGNNDPSIDEVSAEDLAGDYATIRYSSPDDDFYVDPLVRLGTVFR